MWTRQQRYTSWQRQAATIFLAGREGSVRAFLISTLEAYFQGKKELFEGLAIEGLEKEWKEYPILHLDLNARKYDTAESWTRNWTSIWSVGEDLRKRLFRQGPEERFVILYVWRMRRLGNV